METRQMCVRGHFHLRYLDGCKESLELFSNDLIDKRLPKKLFSYELVRHRGRYTIRRLFVSCEWQGEEEKYIYDSGLLVSVPSVFGSRLSVLSLSACRFLFIPMKQLPLAEARTALFQETRHLYTDELRHIHTGLSCFQNGCLSISLSFSLSLSSSSYSASFIPCTHTHFYFFPFGPACVSAYLRNNFKNRHTHTHIYSTCFQETSPPSRQNERHREKEKEKRTRPNRPRDRQFFQVFLITSSFSSLAVRSADAPPPSLSP